MMLVYAKKWGKNIGIRLPRMLANKLGVQAGIPLELQVKNGVLTITSLQPKYTLQSMVNAFNEESLHNSLNEDHLKGFEAW